MLVVLANATFLGTDIWLKLVLIDESKKIDPG
jgi:hypothetical protein